MRAKLTFARLAFIAGGLMFILAPSPAFAHDNVGGDELAVANWMLISALVVAGMGVWALVWAVRAGQFTNIEESKHTMIALSDDYDAIMAEAEARERAATEAAAKQARDEARSAEAASANSERAVPPARI